MSLARNIIKMINNENRFAINEGMKTAINGEKIEVSRKGMNVFKKSRKNRQFTWNDYIYRCDKIQKRSLY
jgi:hypothetical protein